MNLFTKQKWSQQCRKKNMVSKGERGRVDWEIGIDTYCYV